MKKKKKLTSTLKHTLGELKCLLYLCSLHDRNIERKTGLFSMSLSLSLSLVLIFFSYSFNKNKNQFPTELTHLNAKRSAGNMKKKPGPLGQKDEYLYGQERRRFQAERLKMVKLFRQSPWEKKKKEQEAIRQVGIYSLSHSQSAFTFC